VTVSALGRFPPGVRRGVPEPRALLFLGSGLADRYLLDLFSQVIELYGPTSHPHFAIAVRGELDVEFLRRHFGIWVHEISTYDDLPDAITSLRPRGSCRTLWCPRPECSSAPRLSSNTSPPAARKSP
jgi:hypothetical protein